MRAKSARCASIGRANHPAGHGGLTALTIPFINRPTDDLSEWAFKVTLRFPGTCHHITGARKSPSPQGEGRDEGEVCPELFKQPRNERQDGADHPEISVTETTVEYAYRANRAQ